MSITKVIQRSPDLGIGIRLQRLPEAVQTASEPAPAPIIEPKPPVWWGWRDEDGKNATQLSSRWNEIGPDSPYGYWPGLWAAVVDDAVKVEWHVVFTPALWYLDAFQETPPIVLSWSGDPIKFDRPSKLPDTPEHLFTPQTVTLPTHSFDGPDVPPHTYWDGADTTPGFPNIPIPSVIASGNTLSVGQDTKAMSGTLVADASVGGKKVGSVTLELMRVIHRVWS